MCRPGIVWGAVLAAGAAAEAHAIVAHHHDCTLSALTRRTCRTQHPVGRVLFLLGLGTLAAWFARHIVEEEFRMSAPTITINLEGRQ